MAYTAFPSPRKFQDKHQDLVAAMKSIFQRTRFSKDLPLDAVANLLNDVYLLVNTVGVLNRTKNLANHKEDYTYRHSVNVAITAGVLGKWLGLEEEVVHNLILAGLLHDIGKARIPLDILHKPANLDSSEMKIMKKHTVLGYSLLQSTERVSKLVKLWILQHHERLDGSGYPYAFKGGQISYHAQIIAVADIYDAMTSQRFHREADTPFSVIDELSGEMFGKLDPQICTTFLDNLAKSLIGNTVRLNTGTEAKIIYMDSSRLGTKPLLKTDGGECIDLEKTSDIRIVEVYDRWGG